MRMRALIKRHEGLRLKPYLCTSGKLTIGYGRNLEDMGISEEEAEELLENDISRTLTELDDILERYCGVQPYGARRTPWLDPPVSSVRYAALADMLLNLGRPRFLGFRKMLEAIRFLDWDRAADEAEDSRWFRQVKTRGVTIVQMLRTDRWPEWAKE